MVGLGPGLEQEWQGWILLCSPVLSYFPCMRPQVHVARGSRLLQIEICFCPKMDEATSPSETLPCAARLAALGYRFEDGKLRHVVTGEGALELPCWPVPH